MRISETPSPTGLTSPGLPSAKRRMRALMRALADGSFRPVRHLLERFALDDFDHGLNC